MIIYGRYMDNIWMIYGIIYIYIDTLVGGDERNMTELFSQKYLECHHPN